MTSIYDLLAALILGAVQGITEFIPVSSSGHLVIFDSLLNANSNFAFEVLLNIGTLAALVLHTRAKLWSIVKQVLNKDYRLAVTIAVATIPAVLVGLFFGDQIESLNGSVLTVIITLAIGGLLMLWIKEKPKAISDIKDVPTRLLLAVGLFQTLALIPGSSRAGVTILTALYLGLNRKVAAEWSFLLAIPVILGATVKTLASAEGIQLLSDNFAEVVVGNVASFVVGFLAIGLLLKVLQTKSLMPFGYYRLGLAAFLAILLGLGQI